VLTGYLRRELLERSRAVALMQEAEETISAHQDMIDTEQVLQLVSSSNCSSYDCEFVAAAQRLGVPLVTEDRAILGAFPEVAQSLDQATS
jgi:predicted nucleic acid-binding protein